MAKNKPIERVNDKENPFDQFVKDNLDKAIISTPSENEQEGQEKVVANNPKPLLEKTTVATPPSVDSSVQSLVDDIKTRHELTKQVVESTVIKPSETINPVPQGKTKEEILQTIMNGPLMGANMGEMQSPDVNPKEGANPILVATYRLLRRLLSGGAIPAYVPIYSEVDTLMKNIKKEVE